MICKYIVVWTIVSCLDSRYYKTGLLLNYTIFVSKHLSSQMLWLSKIKSLKLLKYEFVIFLYRNSLKSSHLFHYSYGVRLWIAYTTLVMYTISIWLHLEDKYTIMETFAAVWNYITGDTIAKDCALLQWIMCAFLYIYCMPPFWVQIWTIIIFFNDFV